MGRWRAWAVPAIVAVVTVVALEGAQRIGFWPAAILAVIVIVGGLVALSVTRGRE